MSDTAQPPWDDYDSASEDDLEARLDSHVDRALDDNDPSVDEDGARTLAGQIADREEAKRDQGGPFNERLHAEANRIRSADVGSWRPK